MALVSLHVCYCFFFNLVAILFFCCFFVVFMFFFLYFFSSNFFPEHSLSPTDVFVRHCIQLYEMLRVRFHKKKQKTYRFDNFLVTRATSLAQWSSRTTPPLFVIGFLQKNGWEEKKKTTTPKKNNNPHHQKKSNLLLRFGCNGSGKKNLVKL